MARLDTLAPKRFKNSISISKSDDDTQLIEYGQ